MCDTLCDRAITDVITDASAYIEDATNLAALKTITHCV